MTRRFSGTSVLLGGLALVAACSMSVTRAPSGAPSRSATDTAPGGDGGRRIVHDHSS